MKVLIGGSGSTGSSLLRRVLNRHSRIYCGPETSIFCKKELYDSWTLHKGKLLDDGIYNYGYHIYNKLTLVKEESFWKDEELLNMALNCADLEAFLLKYVRFQLEQSGKDIWMEKTPANSVFFSQFLKDRKNKVIHVCRNPYDTVASLVGRGFSAFYAASLYLCNVSFALSVKDDHNYIEVKYEQLVSNPEETIKEVLISLGLEYESEVLKMEDRVYSDDPTKIESWNYHETDSIQQGSIGRFESSSNEAKAEIESALHHIVLSKSFIASHNLDVKSVGEICEVLEYNYRRPESSSHMMSLRMSRQMDRIKRQLIGHPFSKGNYPIDIV